MSNRLRGVASGTVLALLLSLLVPFAAANDADADGDLHKDGTEMARAPTRSTRSACPCP